MVDFSQMQLLHLRRHKNSKSNPDSSIPIPNLVPYPNPSPNPIPDLNGQWSDDFEPKKRQGATCIDVTKNRTLSVHRVTISWLS